MTKKTAKIEILEDKNGKRKKKSKIDKILENPYEVKNFKIYKREEIYNDYKSTTN